MQGEGEREKATHSYVIKQPLGMIPFFFSSSLLRETKARESCIITPSFSKKKETLLTRRQVEEVRQINIHTRYS